MPEERIEKARLAMQLQQTSEKVSQLPNAEEVMQKIQAEYDLLMQRMSDYYTVKKRMMKVRQKCIKRSMERLELDFNYKELKYNLALQREKWLKLQNTNFALS